MLAAELGGRRCFSQHGAGSASTGRRALGGGWFLYTPGEHLAARVLVEGRSRGPPVGLPGPRPSEAQSVHCMGGWVHECSTGDRGAVHSVTWGWACSLWARIDRGTWPGSKMREWDTHQVFRVHTPLATSGRARPCKSVLHPPHPLHPLPTTMVGVDGRQGLASGRAGGDVKLGRAWISLACVGGTQLVTTHHLGLVKRRALQRARVCLDGPDVRRRQPTAGEGELARYVPPPATTASSRCVVSPTLRLKAFGCFPPHFPLGGGHPSFSAWAAVRARLRTQ